MDTRERRNRHLAEKVMGWTRTPGDANKVGSTNYVGDFGFLDKQRHWLMFEHQWSPDRDPAQMMMVLEAMRASGWRDFYPARLDGYEFGFVKTHNIERGYQYDHGLSWVEVADTLPEAICRAAALATGFREENVDNATMGD